MNLKKSIRRILKEESRGQEFADNYIKELENLEKTIPLIVKLVKSIYPDLFVDYETDRKKVVLASIMLDNGKGFFTEKIVLRLKFDLTKGGNKREIYQEIVKSIDDYFNYNVKKYGCPLDLEFKALSWVSF